MNMPYSLKPCCCFMYYFVFSQVGQNDSYLQGCAFHHGFSPAIGIFGTDGLSVDDNVIHHTVGEGITSSSSLQHLKNDIKSLIGILVKILKL